MNGLAFPNLKPNTYSWVREPQNLKKKAQGPAAACIVSQLGLIWAPQTLNTEEEFADLSVAPAGWPHAMAYFASPWRSKNQCTQWSK